VAEQSVIKGFAHTCFNVNDLERSLVFYRDQIGLTEAFPFLNEEGKRTGQYLYLGGRQFIELFERPVDAPVDGQSYKHICLEVEGLTNVVATLRERGVEVSDPKLGKDQSWQAWITDPDGNRIELHDYTEQSWQGPWVK